MSDKSPSMTKSHAIYALVVLVIINSVNYMDRAVVSVLAPLIGKDLSLTDTQLGVIGGLAFTLFYAIMALPIGAAVDRFTRKYVLSAGILVWSAAVFFSGLAGSFGTLFAARALTGAGESSAHPSGVSLLGDYFSQKVRTIAIAVFQMGVPLGAGIGLIVGGILAQKYGWQKTFLVYAIPGVILIPFILLTRDPVRGAQEGLTAADRQGVSSQDFFTKVGKILSTKTLIFHYIATALIQLGIQGYAFWMPTYLVRERGYDIAAAGRLAGIAMLVGGIVGALGGAIVADLWFRRDKTARLKVQTIAATCAIPFIIVSYLAVSNGSMVAAIFIAIILSMAMFPILSAIIVDLVEPQDRGVGMALLLLLQTGIGYSLGPPLIGWISDLSASLFKGLLIVPVAYLLVIVMGIVAIRFFPADYAAVQARIARMHK
jgi:MFS transporter, Spinster family, sphingosine-1-phosphate transporter